jgi:hypothetical protein
MRPHDWDSRLAAFLTARRAMQFDLRDNDCVKFCAAWWVALYGPPCPLETLGIRYSTRREAAAILRAHGGLRRMVGAFVGSDEIAPALAQRGDLVLADNEGREALGVCLGTHIAGPAIGGMEYHLLATGVVAWRV